jgi:uncharacterized protein (DUF1330 family)
VAKKLGGRATLGLSAHHLPARGAPGKIGAQQMRRALAMAEKGYWIAHVRITNTQRYQDYVAANAAALSKYNGRFLVRGGGAEVVEGPATPRRHVVIEFDSFAAAKACYESPEYQAAARIRKEASETELVIVTGYAG